MKSMTTGRSFVSSASSDGGFDFVFRANSNSDAAIGLCQLDEVGTERGPERLKIGERVATVRRTVSWPLPAMPSDELLIMATLIGMSLITHVASS